MIKPLEFLNIGKIDLLLDLILLELHKLNQHMDLIWKSLPLPLALVEQ